MRYLNWIAALAGAVMMVGGCSRETAAPAPSPEVVARAQTLKPADSRLDKLYQQSCRTCHTTGAGGAPLTGDRTTWDSRWSRGIDTLRSSTLRGLNGMPPGGQCFACTPHDYDALIRFMAGREQE